ncbi:FAD-dependent oxidoreductase [Klebsiella pneumoniae]|uniref:FAD-dependent oxidoreductase n=1 Tax=Klebsiella pneumoniae TaxID=573 RepID=UPI00287BA2FD|nr:FAD-dependent oxidoreductase [Klebsiella pneumoniae]
MYDFVIIGGGIIGMSTAMQLIEIYPDARIALLEKEALNPGRTLRAARSVETLHAAFTR